ncbi:uncharacterized protein LOC131234669 [Magnolia sinica]|uniref:uncharacterized protein LOC131234669 n=1 Tax=Magnolia sinica TaxID=86752 RepID=UPI0026598B26|nr:uncharacterized protein LOC131234669 [Magnolia sinica]
MADDYLLTHYPRGWLDDNLQGPSHGDIPLGLSHILPWGPFGVLVATRVPPADVSYHFHLPRVPKPIPQKQGQKVQTSGNLVSLLSSFFASFYSKSYLVLLLFLLACEYTHFSLSLSGGFGEMGVCTRLIIVVFILVACNTRCDGSRRSERFYVKPGSSKEVGYLFGFFPRAVPIPPSGPSKQHNAVGLLSHQSP